MTPIPNAFPPRKPLKLRGFLGGDHRPAEPYHYHLQSSMSKRASEAGSQFAKSRASERVWMRAHAVALVLVGVSACCRPGGRSAQETVCSADEECPEDSACQGGKCVSREQIRPDGLGTAPGGPGSGPRATPEAIWEVDLGAAIVARPAVVDGVAYVGAHNGRFVGVAVRDGRIATDLWLEGMVWSSAAVDARGRLYVGGDDDRLVAIQDGAIVWSLRLGDCDPPRAAGPEGARCDVDAIVVDGDDLYVAADGVYRIGVDGTAKWHFVSKEGASSHVFSRPAVLADAIAFGGQDGFVTALAKDGAARWRFPVGADVDGTAAIVGGGTLAIGADDGVIRGLGVDGALRWQFATGGGVRSGIAVAPDGTLRATSLDGKLYALDPGGALRWSFDAGAPIGSSPVVDAEGWTYFGARDDRVYAIDAGGKPAWSIPLPGDVDGTVAIAEPATLVVGCDDGRLRALK
jgi:outer membrane protein assembly factor BamB